METRIVTLPGKQVRQAKLQRWATENKVRIVAQIRRLPSDSGCVSMLVGVEPLCR